MQRDRKTEVYYVTIGILVFAVLMLGVAYASLNSTLKKSSAFAHPFVATWDVGFEPGKVLGKSLSYSAGNNKSCGSIDVTENIVSIGNLGLNTPGYGCSYALKIRNRGSVSAKIDEIISSQPSGKTCSVKEDSIMTCGNLTYKLTYDYGGKKLLTTGDRLDAQIGVLPVYLIIMYSGSDIENNDIQVGASFTLIYNQV